MVVVQTVAEVVLVTPCRRSEGGRGGGTVHTAVWSETGQSRGCLPRDCSG